MKTPCFISFAFLVTLLSCNGSTDKNSNQRNIDTITVSQNVQNIGVDTAYYLPKPFSKTKLWLKADKDREGTKSGGGVIVHFGYGGTIPDAMKLSDCIIAIKTEKDFNTFLGAKSWAVENYGEIFPYLIGMLTDTTTVGLTNTADLIIPGRDLPFAGHGGSINEDIFTVAGRTAYVLNDITGEKFAIVHPTTTINELKTFQRLWIDWITKLKR